MCASLLRAGQRGRGDCLAKVEELPSSSCHSGGADLETPTSKGALERGCFLPAAVQGSFLGPGGSLSGFREEARQTDGDAGPGRRLRGLHQAGEGGAEAADAAPELGGAVLSIPGPETTGSAGWAVSLPRQALGGPGTPRWTRRRHRL